MRIKEKLDKIDLEIESGLKFKSADRLRNLIQQYPNEQELWIKLAELYYDSGFLDLAGKYWILTEPTEERIKKCVEIYEKSMNYSGFKILKDLVFRGDKLKLSAYAQEKLSDLESDSKKKYNFVPKFKPKSNIQINNPTQKQSSNDWFMGILFISIFILIGLLIIIGFITVIRWII